MNEEDMLEMDDVDPQGDQVLPEEDKVYAFPESHKEDFLGLSVLGSLQDDFEFLGHRIVIKTLNTDETLAVSQICKEFEGTIGYARAYATAIVACALVSADGHEFSVPLGEGRHTTYTQAKQRFNFIKSRWYPPVVDAVYAQYLILEDRVRGVIDAMGKA